MTVSRQGLGQAATPAPAEDPSSSYWQTGNGNEDNGGGSSFVTLALLAWFVVVVVLLACFYWKNRVRRAAERRHDPTLAASNPNVNPNANNGNNHNEKAAQRRDEFQAQLEATTFTVAPKHLVRMMDDEEAPTVVVEVDDSSTSDEEEAAADNVGVVVVDIELGRGNNANDNQGHTILQLPKGTPTTTLVPGQCAICLHSYQVGDCVSWAVDSTSKCQCQHAFHTSCIVAYAETSSRNINNNNINNNNSHSTTTTVVTCPMCRQPFLFG